MQMADNEYEEYSSNSRSPDHLEHSLELSPFRKRRAQRRLRNPNGIRSVASLKNHQLKSIDICPEPKVTFLDEHHVHASLARDLIESTGDNLTQKDSISLPHINTTLGRATGKRRHVFERSEWRTRSGNSRIVHGIV